MATSHYCWCPQRKDKRVDVCLVSPLKTPAPSPFTEHFHTDKWDTNHVYLTANEKLACTRQTLKSLFISEIAKTNDMLLFPPKTKWLFPERNRPEPYTLTHPQPPKRLNYCEYQLMSPRKPYKRPQMAVLPLNSVPQKSASAEKGTAMG